MDIYIKEVIIHQFSPQSLDLQFSQECLELSPRIDEYLRKKIEKVYSDDAKKGAFDSENTFFSHIQDDLMDSSKAISQLWLDAFKEAENQKMNDLIFINFDKEGQPHFAFLRLVLRDSLTDLGQEENRIQLTQNHLPGFGASPDEGLVVNRLTGQYFLLEKRIKAQGSFLHYFSEKLLEVDLAPSPKKSIQTIEKTAQKIAESFQADDFQFQSKLKSSLHKNLEEKQELRPEDIANDLFQDNLTARLTFLDQVKEEVPEKIQFQEIDSQRQLKRLENQKLSLSNGIQLIVPNPVYEDSESVEFMMNEDGTYSILIKNIDAIESL
ncbi:MULTISPECIES: nucleoid-associated protein [unclassified Streptococcus]|uniref:nucleoid-associated protein n=1 Tax=unclassified Streptococcus TaxID=2608887 RepID=UPI001072ACDD|nr:MULTISPECIES: nucleoid-associated protein [unclassified Streptococcus]MBF0805291.1 nucleoid-associated protein [Streptococcus sp. 19428wA2_WM07]TFU29325.1 nucleoid-associated protein [Streptococcus sp. WM07]